MGRILVVDDNAEIRESFRRALERAGHGVQLASDGKTGLEILAAGGVDLVVTDIYMPGGDGLAMLEELRRRSPELPVIVASGSEERLDAALALGARIALLKPFAPIELVEAVRIALNRRRQNNAATSKRRRRGDGGSV